MKKPPFYFLLLKNKVEYLVLILKKRMKTKIKKWIQVKVKKDMIYY